MPIIAANSGPRVGLNEERRENGYGYQTQRHAALGQGTGGLVHRHRPHRSAVRGARTAWHAHPLGQTLVVTSGLGWAQRWGGPKEEIRPGDVVWFPPGEKHWHGAAATTAMTHIAIVEQLNGKSAAWMEKVSDDQYAPEA